MAGIHSWDSKEIGDLRAEILNYCIKDIPRTVLRDIAMKLNKDSISGNWEILAEKLGFTQSSVLDHIIEKAKVQNTYPGLLMLQEWSDRPGSTAFVLLHALREIQREDAVTMLVEKLYELHSLQLNVSVEDCAGVVQFLRVGTQKSAPLHASLENILQHPLYWYDILGPRRDINWNTTSGLLQGVQLTLKLRTEPDQDSMNQIYGNLNQHFHHHHHIHHNFGLAYSPPTSSSTPSPLDCLNYDLHYQSRHNHNYHGSSHGGGGDANNINITTNSSNANQLSGSAGVVGSPSCGASVGGGGGGGTGSAAGEMAKSGTKKFLTRLGMNIPPTPPNMSVTIPVDSPASQTPVRLNVSTSGPVHYIKNNLSGNAPMGFHPNIRVPQSQDKLPKPPLCGPRSTSPQTQAQAQAQIQDQVSMGPERILDNLEPMTYNESTYGLPNLSAFNNFADMSSVQESSRDYELTATYAEKGEESSLTLEKERHPTSYTDVKQPLSVENCRMPCEDDETVPKQSARLINFSGQNAMLEQQTGFVGLESPDKCKSLACSTSPSTAVSVSSLHPDYIAHDTIRFWNNPTSPTSSVGSSSSTLHNSLKDLSGIEARNASSHLHPATREEPLSHLHHHSHHLPHFLDSQAIPHPPARHQGTSPSCQGPFLEGGYVAHSFIERMSENFRRTASAPALDRDIEEEENMQLDLSESTSHVDERMDCSVGEQNALAGGERSGVATGGGRVGSPALHVYSSSLPVSRTRDSLDAACKPRACTYSSYRPDLATDTTFIFNSGQYHQNCPQFFLDDSGYIDMSGSTSHHQHRHGSNSLGTMSPEDKPPISSSSPSCAGFEDVDVNSSQSLDNAVRSRSEQELDNFFFPRDNSHPPPSGDMFMPRNRRPLLRAQESNMLLEGEAEPSSGASDYTYIDPAIVREAEQLDCCDTGNGNSRRISAGSRTDSRRRLSTEKDDPSHRKRAYHRELSTTELEQVPAWNPQVTAETVEGEMEKYINDDGNFVVWRYAVGRRYVISVSHLRSVRHYAIYETEKAGKVYYYIFPKGPRFTSLADMVHNLMTHGVSEPTKTFRTPDGRETTSCRGGIGFSHVRLRNPIPRRRRN